MTTIHRPIGTTTVTIEFPFLIIDSIDKLNNILLTHIGWNVLVLSLGIDHTSFQPHVNSILYKNDLKKNITDQFDRTYVQIPLEISQKARTDKVLLADIVDNKIVKL